MSHAAVFVSFIIPFRSMMVRGGMSIQDKIDQLVLPDQQKKTIIDKNELPPQIE
jgi:hypothetical protein